MFLQFNIFLQIAERIFAITNFRLFLRYLILRLALKVLFFGI